jgi:hypothetical protein
MPALSKNASNVIRTSGAFKDPVRKQDLLDKIMARDFSGDINDLAVNRDLRIERVHPHVIKLTFGVSGRSFELGIRKPRGPRPIKVTQSKRVNKPTELHVEKQPETQNYEEPANDQAERQAPRRKRAVGESHASH